jgi:hypothetical protein
VPRGEAPHRVASAAAVSALRPMAVNRSRSSAPLIRGQRPHERVRRRRDRGGRARRLVDEASDLGRPQVHPQHALPRRRRIRALEEGHAALGHRDPGAAVAAGQHRDQPGQGRLVPDAQERSRRHPREPHEDRRRIRAVAEQIGRLGNGAIAEGAGGDRGGLASARERAGQDAVEAKPHAPQGLGHARVLTPARVGQRAIAVVRPAARIRVPRVGVAHQDETHAVYYRTVAPPISLPRRGLRPTLMAR